MKKYACGNLYGFCKSESAGSLAVLLSLTNHSLHIVPREGGACLLACCSSLASSHWLGQYWLALSGSSSAGRFPPVSFLSAADAVAEASRPSSLGCFWELFTSAFLPCKAVEPDVSEVHWGFCTAWTAY